MTSEKFKIKNQLIFVGFWESENDSHQIFSFYTTKQTLTHTNTLHPPHPPPSLPFLFFSETLREGRRQIFKHKVLHTHTHIHIRRNSCFEEWGRKEKRLNKNEQLNLLIKPGM